MPTHRIDLDRLSLSQLTRLTGRAPATIRERLEGLEPVAQDGRTRWYEPQAALERIYGGSGYDLTAERARLAKEQADKLAMDNAETRGELVRGGSVESWLVSLLSGLVVRMRAIPAKAAPEAHGAASIAEVEAVYRRHQDEVLAEIADARFIAPAPAERAAAASDAGRAGDAATA